MTLEIRLGSAGQMTLNDEPIADLVALESVLSAESRKTPQPDLILHWDEPCNYHGIGKIIYMVNRVGFAEGNFSIASLARDAK